MLTFSVLLLALFASSQGRAVNISNTWVLPEEGFPVFYRYFRDRISWYEADAVCQFHHANLVTVDTTAQYDAVRAYLKELDISSAVWVGLIRSNPDGDFTWTDYRGLSGDGYWSAAPDARAAPLCAAADPAADYRWEARACGGPTVASFICELPVPQWALGSEGCMVKALPALTILYLPESAAVQLTADCGLAGVKRVQCTGNVKRETLLKDLSCNEEDELTTTPLIASEGSSTNYSPDVAAAVTDIDVTSEQTTEDDITTKHTSVASSVGTTQATPIPIVIKENLSNKKQVIANKVNNMYTQKDINIDLLHNNNLQSNDIPKLANNENFLSLEQTEKLEDEKHMHHKMLHDELARHGNFETIFTQPTDHFVPPLVMAKAKISDDMTVLSLAEKHAQQLAEQQKFVKHNILNEHNYIKSTIKPIKEQHHKIEIIDKPLVITIQPTLLLKENYKKDNVKSALPKKYKEKYDDPKAKSLKIDGKLLKFEKPTEKSTTPLDIATSQTEISTNKIPATIETQVDDGSLELTVELKEPKIETLQKSDDIAKFENIALTTETVLTTGTNVTEQSSQTTTTKYYAQNAISSKGSTEKDTIETTENALEQMTGITNKQDLVNLPLDGFTSTRKPNTQFPIQTDAIMQDLVMNHEVIKITIVDDLDKTNLTRTVYEITTLAPVFKDTVAVDKSQQSVTTQATTIIKDDASNTPTSFLNIITTQKDTIETTVNPNTVNVEIKTNSTEEVKIVSTQVPTTTEKNTATPYTILNELNKSDNQNSEHLPATNSSQITDNKKVEDINITEIYEIDSERNSTDPDAIDDYNSPLLSAANEPLHRPNRSRRPQPPNRLTKFNPFRILG